jgi:hypothetical protein
MALIKIRKLDDEELSTWLNSEECKSLLRKAHEEARELARKTKIARMATLAAVHGPYGAVY